MLIAGSNTPTTLPLEFVFLFEEKKHRKANVQSICFSVNGFCKIVQRSLWINYSVAVDKELFNWKLYLSRFFCRNAKKILHFEWLKPVMSLQLLIPCVSGIWTRLTWLWWFGFRLEPISGNDRTVPKIVAHSTSGQKWLKKIISLLYQSLDFIPDTLCRRCMLNTGHLMN